MGAGIGGMHYTGMAAMRSSAMHHYTPWIVALSVVTAVTFSWFALRVGFVLRDSEGSRIAAAVLMGLGVAAMHYVAMAAVHFTADGMSYSTAWTAPDDTLGAIAVIAVAIFVLAVALITAAVDKARFRRLSAAHDKLARAQSELLQSQEQLKEANALLSELSIRDGLTGLYNRRHFDAVLGTEWRRAVRSRTPLSLLMIDVDCFKMLNDRYGHQRGDDCLREIARVLEDLPRRGYDTSARYGGEEFAILLPEADAQGAFKVAESIRRGVLDLQIDNEGCSTGPYLSVSIGICTRRPTPEQEPESMVRDADTALYGAKQLGRNRTEIATEININA
jgi:diguanylate cyclase (GGDEF)-like protein